MKILNVTRAHSTQDGAGVKIQRIAGFDGKSLDPFLMIDELKSNNSQDYIGGFPAHPHRGIETFTYIRKGGFEHQDQMGNKKAIRAGQVQWMSTGRGVIHSEMPLADAQHGMHGFQIWLNMAAKDKMNTPKYQDSSDRVLPFIINESGAQLTALAGNWTESQQSISSGLDELAGTGAISDIWLKAHSAVHLDLSHYGKVLAYIHTGALKDSRHQAGYLLNLDPQAPIHIESQDQAAGLLLLAGQPINERIAHMGPFVMNTQEELKQAVRDYQAGKFGSI
ncbi:MULTISPECIES: pirin family protein [Pseudoalteromonas]|uniref:Pirin-related protein n=1 Tax=Pseudoalteromonas luteoviolacea (strain 2ta16) TaxID=1353533 RepID=V4H4M9_PSEL2|nr:MULTISPECIES: pirin family protein [Pseudoalteromonas]ESP92426.1 Pirin-related protein [Pseudoalteromonas luteoviolacea 2ta16]MCG7550718.1 pirin family protein [Pseudoalteromonas sp. Of7M-16]